jgi:hypothetical protein
MSLFAHYCTGAGETLRTVVGETAAGPVMIPAQPYVCPVAPPILVYIGHGSSSAFQLAGLYARAGEPNTTEDFDSPNDRIMRAWLRARYAALPLVA